MKKILLPILIALTSITSVFAQSKVAYVEYDYLISLMPELVTIQQQLQTKGKEYEGIVLKNQQEMQAIEQAIQQNPDMDPMIKEGKIRRYQQLQQETQQFSYQAQQKLEAMEMELIKPVYARLDKAIGEVAAVKGFDYVLSKNNAGGYTIVYSKNESDNITKAVVAKLDLKEVVNPATVTGETILKND